MFWSIFLLREIFESLLNQLQQPSLVKSGKWEQYLVKKKIPFHLLTTQKKVFSSLEDVLCGKISTTDLVLLTPNLSPSCPKCSSQCISQTTQALCFLKQQTWQCEGKKFLAFIPYLSKCSSSVHCHEWDRNGWKMKTIQARLSSWLDDSCQQPGVRHPLGWKPSADSKPNEYRWTAKNQHKVFV